MTFGLGKLELPQCSLAIISAVECTAMVRKASAVKGLPINLQPHGLVAENGRKVAVKAQVVPGRISQIDLPFESAPNRSHVQAVCGRLQTRGIPP